MNTYTKKIIDLHFDLKNNIYYHLKDICGGEQISVEKLLPETRIENTPDKEKIRVDFTVEGTNTRTNTYPLVEYNNDELYPLVEVITSKIHTLLGKQSHILKTTDSDYDIKITLYSVNTLQDKQRVVLELSRDKQRIKELLTQLTQLNPDQSLNQTPSEGNETHKPTDLSKDTNQTSPSEDREDKEESANFAHTNLTNQKDKETQ